MKKKIIFMTAMVMFLSLVLAACGQGKNNNEEPKSEISGFYSWQQIYQGGNKKENKNINISNLSVENSDKSSNISIEFQKGSTAAGIDSSKISSVPKYTIYGLDSPYRFVVKLENITFWDYVDEFMGIEDTGIILDVFQPHTSTKEKEKTQDVYLFFQLNAESAFSVEEKGGTLNINVRNVSAKSKDKVWYAISPLYYEWEKMIDGIELNPTMLSDFSRYQLISKPFESKEAAENFAKDTKPKLQKLGLIDSLIIKEADRGALPEITSEDEKALFAEKNVIRVNGKEKTLPLLMAFGQYLTSTPDGNTKLFAKDIGSSGEGSSYVELYTLDNAGKETKLKTGEFPSITRAGYSNDGNKLAIQSLSTRSELNIYDFSTGKTINLGEEGIGNDIASFAWDKDSNLIHVVAGDNGAFQMKTYNFSKPAGSRISVLSERPLDQNGSFEYFNGELYFSIQSSENGNNAGAIYRVDKKTGKTEKVTDGFKFVFSPDGKYLAVEDITDTQALNSNAADAEVGEGAQIEGLKIIDTATKKETRVVSNVNIVNFVWNRDSSAIFFAQNQSKENPKETKFKNGLFKYIPQTDKKDKILDMTSDQFSAGRDNNTLLVLDYVDQFFATYILDLNDINK